MIHLLSIDVNLSTCHCDPERSEGVAISVEGQHVAIGSGKFGILDFGLWICLEFGA